MTRITYDIPYVDDDGIALIIIEDGGVEIARHRVRCDIADRWAWQEVAILTERRIAERAEEAV